MTANNDSKPLLLLLLLLNVLLSIEEVNSYSGTTSDAKERCEEITIPMCRGIGYNYTSMPNQFHHDTQEEAGLEVHQFWPLVEIQCSDDLRFFLCSMYTPICIDDYQGRLPACRSVCERAKSGCAPIMRQYGFAWPERMNCDDLPPYGHQQHLCMDSKEGAPPSQQQQQQPSSSIDAGYGAGSFSTAKPASAGSGVGSSSSSSSKDRTRYKSNRNYKTNANNNSNNNNNNNSQQQHRHLGTSKTATTTTTRVQHGLSSLENNEIESVNRKCECECRKPMILLNDGYDRKYNRVETGGIMNCVKPCSSVFFKEKQQSLATTWITIIAIACAITTSLTILTFITDPERFRYPERSIIYLSACYLMVSIGFIVRSWIGHSAVACENSMIRYQATGPGSAACVTVFLLIYFFGMASSVWWVILTLTWFLASGLKWGNEAIAGYSQYFHLIAWFVPTIKSIVILAMGAVDGDSFTGICYVGNQDLNNLKNFVLIPLCVYLFLGFIFLFAGFVSLFRIRTVIRQQAKAKADKLEKLIARIVISSFLYIVPGIIVIACYFYEYFYRQKWEISYNCRHCHQHQHQQQHQHQHQQQQQHHLPQQEWPYYFVFLLKYIASLIVGITSSFWIWSGKTIESWHRFYGRFCCDSSSSSRSGASQLIIGTQFIGSNNQRTYKQMHCNQQSAQQQQPQPQQQQQLLQQQQQAYSSSASHIASYLPHSQPHSKQLPLSHV